MLATFLVAVLLRWRRASPAERRDLAPLWVAAGIYLVAGLLGAFASPNPTAQPFAYLIWELQSVLQIGLPLLFLWGLLSTRLACSAVGDLVMELDRPLLPGELRASLAKTLGDPSLQVLYLLEGQDRWVDVDGRPVPLPGRGGGRQAKMVTVVEREDQPLAALIHDPALDQGLVRAAAAAAGMAIVNERLQAEVRAQLEEVRASRQRIVEASDAERRRVVRNLHDGAQQRLVTLALSLAMLRDRAGCDTSLAASLDQAAAELKQAIAELRELARGIHPAILTEEGLPAAVEALADRSSVPVRVRADFDERLPGPIKAIAYFVVSESLANVTKYARASMAQVELSRRNGHLRVEVVDDGVGGADANRGSGLRGLEDRVAAVRGSFRVQEAPGGRTCVLAESPAMPEPPPSSGKKVNDPVGPEGGDAATTSSAAPAMIRVVLADDSVLFREGIARVLAENGFAVAGQAGDADELDALVERDIPDVVVTDVRMPPTNTNEGLLAAQRIRARHPQIGVLVLSHYVETRQAIKLLQNAPHGVGYLLKDRVSDIAEFADSVRRVAHGGSAIDPEVVAHLLRRRGAESALEDLTVREQDILALMAQGRSNRAICERLFLAPKTVETHVGAIFAKLGLLPAADDHRRVLAVITYLKNA